MRVVLTAGFDRAPNTLALAELLRRDGHEVAAIFVVTPFRLKRLRSMVRQRGWSVVLQSLPRLWRGSAGFEAGPLDAFLTSHRIEPTSLHRWCSAHRVPHHVVADLNADRTVRRLEKAAPDLVVYGGGGILRRPFLLAAGRCALNAHSGPLPQVRGMNACEWSLLLGVPPAVTIHKIDEGIDTGQVIERIPLIPEPDDTIERLRSKCVVLGIEGLRRAVETCQRLPEAQAPDAARHRQCFVMAPVVRELLEWKLAHHNATRPNRAA